MPATAIPMRVRPVQSLASLLLILSVTACSASAQVRPDSIHHRNGCRLAVQIVRTGHPAPHTTWAFEEVGHCGEAGGEAVAARIRADRQLVDTATLAGSLTATANLVDGAVFLAAADVAGDGGASVEARAFALRTLALSLRPGQIIGYGEFTGSDRGPRRCFGLGAPGHFRPQHGSPLPSNARTIIDDLTLRLWRDESVPPPVRQAASCTRAVAGFARR
jgi:hypothetical protein